MCAMPISADCKGFGRGRQILQYKGAYTVQDFVHTFRFCMLCIGKVLDAECMLKQLPQFVPVLCVYDKRSMPAFQCQALNFKAGSSNSKVVLQPLFKHPPY